MQNLEDLKEKIFFEAKNIIETLSKISSSEELLLKKELIEELDERISFIKILEKNEDFFLPEEKTEYADELFDIDEAETLSLQHDEDPIEEEVRFTNELNDIQHDEADNTEQVDDHEEVDHVEMVSESIVDETKAQNEEHLILPDSDPVFQVESEEIVSEDNVAQESEEDFAENYRRNVEEKERALEELEERRRKIVEIEKPTEVQQPEIHPDALSEIQKQHHEHAKKFKLAHIKGLKNVQSLFDDDPLEHIQDIHTDIPKEKTETKGGSLLKSNVPTDYMEADKPKPELRLDLNDKIAFSKTLFSGSQSELNDAIRHINNCQTAEEAKEFLSDLYYAKNWKKVDEYAQRLWVLVENKYL